MQTRLTFENGKFVLYTETTEYIKALNRAKHWKLLKAFREEKTGKYVYSFTTENFKVAAELKNIADTKARKILDRAFVKRYSLMPPLPPFLDPHQREGVLWSLSRSRSYLAHAPGAGKTCEAIVASLLSPFKGKTLFIVPPTLTTNWEREIFKFYDLLEIPNSSFPTIYVIGDTNTQDRAGWSSDFLIVPDSMLAKPWVHDSLMSLEIKFIAVDEASRFKDPRAERSIALYGGSFKNKRKTSGLIYKAPHCVFLDGSPMPNRPMELWAPTYAMSPESIDFMNETEFGFKYCGPKINNFGTWEFKHSSNESELKKRLQKSFMHVVSESALNHPERMRSMVFINTDARSTAHKEWEKKNLTILNFSEIDEHLSQGDIATYRKELGLRKVPWVAQYVSEKLADKNESILLFAWHREVCFELEWKLRKFNPGLIMGGVPDKVRELDFKEFQEGTKKLLILNIAAGGRGHNLQKADRAVFAEFSWSDELNKQCEKRASRKGSDKTLVRCEYIISPGSMDEPILNAVFNKAKRVKNIIGS